MEKGELNRILQEIEERNFAEIEFPLSYQELKELADSFLDFCELPQDVKSGFTAPYKDDPHGLVGYSRRDKSRGNFDTKELFHYHDAMLNLIPELKASDEPKIRRFADAMHKVYVASVETFKKHLKHFSQDEPGIYGQFFREGRQRCYIRLLKYDEVPVGATVGAGHYDRGGLAFALAESAPGLRIWHRGKPQDVVHKSGTALFMPGITFNDTTTKIKLPKTWHDVVQKTPPIRPGVSRWAIAFFADPIEQREVTAEEARTHNY